MLILYLKLKTEKIKLKKSANLERQNLERKKEKLERKQENNFLSFFLSVSVSFSFSQFVCLSVSLPLCVSLYLSIYISVSLYIYIYIYIYKCLWMCVYSSKFQPNKRKERKWKYAYMKMKNAEKLSDASVRGCLWHEFQFFPCLSSWTWCFEGKENTQRQKKGRTLFPFLFRNRVDKSKRLSLAG